MTENALAIPNVLAGPPIVSGGAYRISAPPFARTKSDDGCEGSGKVTLIRKSTEDRDMRRPAVSYTLLGAANPRIVARISKRPVQYHSRSAKLDLALGIEPPERKVQQAEIAARNPPGAGWKAASEMYQATE
jgi:hypothetical protein